MDAADPKKPITVTRETLYALVWKQPMKRLAEEYGISGNGLAKICDRLNIPYPPRGHWAKLAAGKEVTQTPLPEGGNDTPSTVEIAPTPPRVAAPTIDPKLASSIDATREKFAELQVPEVLRKPHPVVASWVEKHARDLADARRSGWTWTKPLTDLERRRHRILDTLFKQVEKLGISVRAGHYNDVWFECGKDRIDFSLQERIRQIRRPVQPGDNHWNPNQKWTQEKIPTGELTFRIRTYIGVGIQQDWTETAESPLEQQLPAIIAVLKAAGPLLEEKRLQAEEAERRHQEEAYKRQQAADRRKQDWNRWRRFLEIADKWDQSAKARAFLTLLENVPGKPDADIGGRSHQEWLQWCREWLAAYDPTENGVDAIWKDIDGVNAWNFKE